MVYGRDVLGEVPALALAARHSSGPPGDPARRPFVGSHTRQLAATEGKGRARPAAGRYRWGKRQAGDAARVGPRTPRRARGPGSRHPNPRRAREGLEELRADRRFVSQGGTFSTLLVRHGSAAPTWWTLALPPIGRWPAAWPTSPIRARRSPTLRYPSAPEVSPWHLQVRARITAGAPAGGQAARGRSHDREFEVLGCDSPHAHPPNTVSRRLANGKAVRQEDIPRVETTIRNAPTSPHGR